MSERLSPEVLREVYPEGMLLYFMSDDEKTDCDYKEVVSKKLPGFLPLYSSRCHESVFSPSIWLTDHGMQLGSQIYGNSIFYEELINLLQANAHITKEEAIKVLPEFYEIDDFRRDFFVNGYVVPIGGSDCVLHGGSLKDLDIYTHAGYNTKSILPLSQYMFRQQWEEGGGIPVTYPHVDTSITGFMGEGCTYIYLDEMYEEIAPEILSLWDTYDRLYIESIPHEQAQQGALNIRYLDTHEAGRVLVPSKRVLGPIASRLQSFGYNLIELGEDQVKDKGGVKCRTMPLRWR